MRILRGDDPGPYGDYRDYKKHLRPLFRSRCAYCLTPDDILGGLSGMTVDHFRPRNRYEHLSRTWTNLYYACGPCNEHYKKSRPTLQEEADGLGFVDPCEHDPCEHFRLARERRSRHRCLVKARKPTAEFSIDVLKLNYRPDLRDFWRALEVHEAEAKSELKEVFKLSRNTRRLIRRLGKLPELEEYKTHLRKKRQELERLVDICARRPFAA